MTGCTRHTTPDGRLAAGPVKDVDPRYLSAGRLQGQALRVTAASIRGTRAVWQLIGHQRIVSGGSTLTMQVARLLQGEHERTGAGKVRQALRAVALERRLAKDAILRLYLRMAPFGGNLEGVRAASLAYFGKEPRRLSLAEAALLVALPQSPEMRRPDRYTEAARRARNRVLDRAVAAGAISASDAERAKADRMPTVRREFPMLAPHLADAEVEQNRHAWCIA
jgi:penicillin-binding protein 1C